MRANRSAHSPIHRLLLSLTILLPFGVGHPALAGTLFPIPAFVVGQNPTDCVSGDFNSDGRADLAVANSSSSFVSILLGADAGVFSPEIRVAVGDGPFSIAQGDFNGVFHDDVTTGNLTSDDLSVLLGRGDGTFEPEMRVEGAGLDPRSPV